MDRNRWLDEIAAQPPDARQRALLVSAGEAAKADNIRDQDRRKLSGLAHCIPPAAGHYHKCQPNTGIEPFRSEPLTIGAVGTWPGLSIPKRLKV